MTHLTEPSRPPSATNVAIPTETLVERYAQMAHTFEPRGVDRLLRAPTRRRRRRAASCSRPCCCSSPSASGHRAARALPRRPRRPRRRIFTMYKFRTLRADAETRIGGYYGAELTAADAEEQTLVGSSCASSTSTSCRSCGTSCAAT